MTALVEARMVEEAGGEAGFSSVWVENLDY